MERIWILQTTDRPGGHDDLGGPGRGRIRTCNGVGSGGMSESQVQEFDAALAELLRHEFPQEPLMIRHRVWAVVVGKPKADLQ